MDGELKVSGTECPVAVADIEAQTRRQFEEVIAFCKEGSRAATFFAFEQALCKLMAALGRLLIALFLATRHRELDLQPWLADQRYRLHPDDKERELKTVYGPVRYWRAYVIPRQGGAGFHPLDVVLGLTRDCFSPLVIKWVTRLATRLSFKASELVCRAFLGWSPSTEAMECLVLGLGRQAGAYMVAAPAPSAEGEVLVIEVDGKASPTATATELKKRRGKRRKRCGCGCGCQRHRGQAKRKRRGPKKRRKKGDKSKNGRSATLVVMYTLQRGADGKLHGPVNKKVWGSYAPRAVMLQWARDQATKRGFPPDTTKTVQIVIDGETCLAKGLGVLFPKAIFTIDVHHVVERLWQVGRLYHAEGSTALADWVEEFKQLLYDGEAAEIVKRFRQLLEKVPSRGPGTKTKRTELAKQINYLEPRLEMMRYREWKKQDLVLASGVVEGAARYVVGERLDNSGMRWIEGKAEAVLQLRCIELNGDWDAFFDWAETQWRDQLRDRKPVLIRTNKPIPLPEAA